MRRQQFTTLASIAALFVFTYLAPLPVTPQNGGSPAVPIKKCWEYDVNAISAIASDNALLFISRTGARIDSVSFTTGRKIWTTELGGEPVSNIAVGDSQLFLVTLTNGPDAEKTGPSVLRSLSKDTGITNWSVQLPRADAVFLGISGANVVFVSRGGDVAALDRKSGRVIWQRSVPEGLSTVPHFGPESVIFGTNSKEIFILSLADGSVRFNTKTQSLLTSVIRTADNQLVWGDQRGNLVSYTMDGREIRWKFKGGAQISHIATAGDDLLVTSLDNFIYRISAGNGNVLWKKRQAGRVTSAPVVASDFAVVITNGERTGQIIDPVKGKLINQLTLSDGNDFLRSPVILGDMIVFPTAAGLIAYSINGCGAK